MKQRVNYVSLMILFALFLSVKTQAQTIADRITKADVQPKRERMPNVINTLLHDEYAPAISPDGRTLVYQSNKGGKTWEYYRLWHSMRDTVTGFWTEPKPIDEINGDFKQGDIFGGPALSYDGRTLYFFAKMGDGGSEDIYQSTKGADGKWSKPEKVAGAINSGDYEGFPSISPDGMFLYFVRKKDGGSSSSTAGAESDKGKDSKAATKYPSCYKMFVAKRKLDGSFGEPAELPSPIPGDCDKHVRIMPDGQSLFFSSTRTWLSPKDSKDFDLYYSMMQPGGAWTAPVLTDMSPWVKSTMYSYQPDMLVSVAPNDNPHVLAYFNAYMGASHELFTYPLQERFKPKRTCWFNATIVDSSDLKKLKPTVKVSNLTRDPLSYDKMSDEGKFKTVLTEGNKYRFLFELDGYEPVTFVVDLTKDMSEWECSKMVKMRKKGVLATVTILDGLTNELIAESNADIKPDESGKGKVSEFKKTGPGKFFALLEPGTTYTANGTADQYEPSSVSLDLKNKVAGDTINREIFLFDLSKIVFQNINFETARPRTLVEKELDAALLPKARAELDKVYKFMSDYPKVSIRIEAHTDDRGGDAYNQGLSERRAAAAKHYLTKTKGISADRLEIRASGEKSPSVPNNSPANLALNRRVEFKPVLKR